MAGHPRPHHYNSSYIEYDPVSKLPPQPPVRPAYGSPPVMTGKTFGGHPEDPEGLRGLTSYHLGWGQGPKSDGQGEPDS